MVYTAADAFFEALWEAGVSYCFVNLGSDHPALMEAISKGTKTKGGDFPKIITCPSEMVAMSMADGYARATGRPQAVVVHVDVGTQALGCAMHNAHIARSPVLVFAGLCPATIEGEERGSRTEWVNFVQDIPDQSAIVRQYCRYTNEIRAPKNVKQMVNRALQFATSAPKGPVYLYAARETFEQEIEPYSLDKQFWGGVGPGALPLEAVEEVADALMAAKEPLIVTGYSGRHLDAPGELVKLADAVKGLRVLDTSIGDVCFPADHPGWLGARYSKHESIPTADFILVLDCDVPWVPVQCKPNNDAVIYHIDVDPLKRSMPVHYINAVGRWQADTYTAIKQLNAHISSNSSYKKLLSSSTFADRASSLSNSHSELLQRIAQAATPSSGPSDALNANMIAAQLKKACPTDTTWCVEAVTNTFGLVDQLQCTRPGSFISSGATGLGGSGGVSLGVKLATSAAVSQNVVKESNYSSSFVVQIVGDGSYLFSAPSSVYWISTRYNIPILTIILNNKGWNAPRVSLELVHPTGVGSKISNSDLNISFDGPSPDYAGIAKAASGGKIHTAYANTWGELEDVLPEAIEVVKNGTTAVVECRLKGLEGKVDQDDGEATAESGGVNGKRKFDDVEVVDGGRAKRNGH